MQKRKGQRELRKPFQNAAKTLRTLLFENSVSKEVFDTESKEPKNIVQCHNGAPCLLVRYQKRYEILHQNYYFLNRKKNGVGNSFVCSHTCSCCHNRSRAGSQVAPQRSVGCTCAPLLQRRGFPLKTLRASGSQTTNSNYCLCSNLGRNMHAHNLHTLIMGLFLVLTVITGHFLGSFLKYKWSFPLHH